MERRIHRFDFGSLRDFRGPIVAKAVETAQAQEAPPPPPPPVFTEQDLESARLAGKKQGYAEGFTAGKAEAQKEADIKAEEANTVIAQIGHMVSGLQARYQRMLAAEATHLSSLTLSIARKVAGEAINERGEQAIMAIVERCLPVMFSKPKLIVELNPDNFEKTINLIETYLSANGFEGEIQFKANPSLGISDIHLDWYNGNITRSAEALWDEINTLVERVPLEITFADTLDTDTKSTGE